ncbi:MAG: DNA recombination protein RmuC [bacterium]
MDSSLLIFLLILAIAALIAIIVMVWRLKNLKGGSNEEMAVLLDRLSGLSDQNQNLHKVIDEKLAQTHAVNQEQFGQTTQLMKDITNQSAKYIADVTEKLTKLDETNKQVVDFSSQLKNLQDILKNPKQRGVLGEYFLEETLKNVLPPNSYQMQYAFENGEIVDAVVFIKEKIIPIDSKFSLENYEKLLNNNDPESRLKLEKQFRQDVKNRIDETSKYIRPSENTMDFAFMFIPSEAIYYDLLVNKVGAVTINTRDLIEYAFADKKVIIVSPTSFLAYLQTVLQGLRGMQIEESAKHIRANIEKLGNHLLSYEMYMKKLGTSMSNTVSHYNNAYKEFKKVDKDVTKITEGKSKVEILKLDKPQLDE